MELALKQKRKKLLGDEVNKAMTNKGYIDADCEVWIDKTDGD